MKKILFVANVAKEHILKFHVPTIKKFKDEGWTVDVACSGEEEIPYCDTQYRGVWKRSPFTFKTFSGIRQLKKIINEQNYDIVYCHTPVGGGVARLAARRARKRGTKVVYFAHGLHFYKGAPLVNWLTFYPVEKHLAKSTDMLITINHEDFERARKKFNKSLDIRISSGVGINFDRLRAPLSEKRRDEIRSEMGIPADATVLVYVAELIKNKNQGILIDALTEIHKKNKNVYLLLVGPDHSNGRYQKYAKKRGIEGFVKFTGWRSDIGDLLRISDICVASSIREGFGINLVEAMYCNLPVIASENRGHVSIIKDEENGFLFKLGDYKKIAETVNSMISGEIDKKVFSHFDVSQYDCNTIADTLYEMLTSKISGNN